MYYNVKNAIKELNFMPEINRQKYTQYKSTHDKLLNLYNSLSIDPMADMDDLWNYLDHINDIYTEAIFTIDRLGELLKYDQFRMDSKVAKYENMQSNLQRILYGLEIEFRNTYNLMVDGSGGYFPSEAEKYSLGQMRLFNRI